MNVYQAGRAWGSVAIAIFFAAIALAETSQFHPITTPLNEMVSGQEILKLSVHVVDADGKPVAGAKVTPWALRSSQGHGFWRKGDKQAGCGPEEVSTDADG